MGAGCALPPGSLFLSNGSNLGLQLDATPPQTYVGYSKQEIFVLPEYPGGDTLPVVSHTQRNPRTGRRIPFIPPTFDEALTLYTGGAAVFHAASTMDEPWLDAFDADPTAPDTPPSGTAVPGGRPWGLFPWIARAIDFLVPGRQPSLSDKKYFIESRRTLGFGLRYSWLTSSPGVSLGSESRRSVMIPLKEIVQDSPTGVATPGLDGKSVLVWIPSFLAILDLSIESRGEEADDVQSGLVSIFASAEMASRLAALSPRDFLPNTIDPADGLSLP